MHRRLIPRLSVALPLLASPALAQAPPGESPALGNDRITQAEIVGGGLDLDDIRAAGLKIFSTPFNKLDGYGDGPVNPGDPVSPGGRPTLQGNGTFLRINGLDSQTCMECHSVGSNAVAPFRFAIGGVGGSNNNAMFQPQHIDVDDEAGNGFAAYDGRFINPPFLFGSGGVELLGREMTKDLQFLKGIAQDFPGLPIPLYTHGVNFGLITYDVGSQSLDTSGVLGIDDDLVVRPFGRKGEFATVRGFDVGALDFHLGMQPVETVGPGVDGDGDGVTDEILIGELSALHIFNTNLEKPEIPIITPEVFNGVVQFVTVGCANCHLPFVDSYGRDLDYAFPEVDDDPEAYVYYSSDLTQSPAGFEALANGGLRAFLFSDFRRHDMGPGLAESFGSPLDSQFITARLWGVADTAPYLHDGRATTLTEAILLHGGEAQASRNAFDALPDVSKEAILTFLRALRTPVDPATDLVQ